MKDKYVRFTSKYPHYQVDKFNGTRGYVEFTEDMIGTYSCEADTYVFDAVADVKPELISSLVLKLRDCGKTIFRDGQFDIFHDEDDRRIKESFEKRLFLAKTNIDVSVAKMYFEAAQINRLEIKATLMRLRELTPAYYPNPLHPSNR